MGVPAARTTGLRLRATDDARQTRRPLGGTPLNHREALARRPWRREVLDRHDRSLVRWTQVGPDGETFMTGVSSAVHRDGLLADVTGFFLPA
ncbi:hypothetical protein [Streptomyces sp. NPDC058664]|uniref:hypothetical protein n=1 Tax=unclassified Streptomyces TaxID=2593676 RepID=UPI0036553BD1